MIKLYLNEKTEKFREEIKSWIAQNTPPRTKKDSSLDDFIHIGREWQKKLSQQKFIGVHWPENFGGRGLTLAEEAIAQEELAAAKAPQILGLFGLTMVGPVLIKHGTKLQKEKYLQKILEGSEIWCQGFSEPEAGSDLANLKTKAVKVDGGYRITGQKVWTSFAHVADYCFLLARTSEEDKKHKGLTYFLLPMSEKGISVRPLKQISGEDEFNEVFFEDVFVPEENIVGKIGEGWSIAISTLMYERVVLTFARQIQSENCLRSLIEKYKDTADKTIKSKIASCISTANAVRALSYSHLLTYAEGKDPGPEGSLDKLFWSESFQALSTLALALSISSVENEENNADTLRYLYSRGRTIAAGTSEIQKNIIAERLLGLGAKR